ncbi:MAG: transporter [Burkholderiales bacterium 35-55-47]|jgi:outer membrane protein TolC|uniref:TolC family protein n=1 Tax=Limnohabitans sp. TaxID=1907725 RepID=UPI000BD8B830|nr:TolC family protein [Limnohabitans sp.]OYY18852.1 MAG: transporter [Burkholderiales bacterium 35-55-47]OYZ73671.1 MAG: transporter [Burkholderiales bacterium 24-55-52]OZB00816.1 MAG: transporter [Burkholderiales bacterium 39-55-53]HQR85419.1 TolC family protein [Limnohabitans sp.]HQS26664.1 TolC family protein [Limnohabitans sp.]
MKFRIKRTQSIVLVTAVLGLTGCASFNIGKGVDRVNRDANSFTQGELNLAQNKEERDKRLVATTQLLAKPVGQKEAVQLLLANSPAFQALLAQNWAESASAAQSGRISNPTFAFESVVTGSETELNRFLSFGLLDVITLPQRSAIANYRVEQAQIRMTAEVVDQVTRVRQAWVRAVAAEQSLKYAGQVLASAEASAELARRMESVGNFNKLTRARHQAFYADAATQLANAKQVSLSRKEELVRLLGLDEAQAKQLVLPERLPNRPKQPMSPEDVAKQVSQERLDIQQAKAALNAAAKAQGLNMVTSFTDIELSVRRGTVSDSSTSSFSARRGYEVGVKLPIFDWGDLQRDAMNAQTLSAANQLEATIRSAGSSLRENYAAYRTAYDISRHYKDEVIPLRKVISEENVLRYNGMIIGVFELLADSRDQIGAVISAIAAEQQFWLADAALQATLIGRPTSIGVAAISTTQSNTAAGH